MDKKRAKDIVSSPNMVDVTYNGSRVYMEKVNDSNNTCTIHYLSNPRQQENVALSLLMEH